jgi:Zn-dependent peptidase ImmA (M78 family)
MPTVNPAILVWARKTAGLSPESAAAALGMKDRHNRSAVERLAAYESGDREPSRPLLLKMAQKYRRPLLLFYLPAPPKRGDRGEDFRSVPDKQTGSEGLIDALLRDVRARQATVRDVLLDDDAHQTLSFIGSMNMADGVGAVATSIGRVIRTDLAEYRDQPSPQAAFTLLRDRAEAAGIFVLLIGNLGSHHTAISVEAFRGFALADDVAPFVVINDQDAPAAWSFTLLHELAHLWLGKTGISGRHPDAEIEKFCNDVAGAFLLPVDELASIDVGIETSADDAMAEISEFAAHRNLSGSMVAYRLYRASKISERTWHTVAAAYLAHWRRSREAKREQQKDAGGGPNYYVVRRHRLGQALLRLVARSVADGALTPTRASKVLGVKARSVAPLLDPILAPGGRAA